MRQKGFLLTTILLRPCYILGRIAAVLTFLLIILPWRVVPSFQTKLPDLKIEHVTWSPQFPQEDVDYKNTHFKITI